MNEIYIKHNPFLLKTDILVDGKEPRDDSDLYYLIYKEQRINKWIKYLPECLTSSFNQTGFDFVFSGIKEDAQFIKEHLEKSQDIQVESFCHYESNMSISWVKSELIKAIERILDSAVEGIDRSAFKNILESLSNKNFSNIEDEIADIINTKEEIMRLFDCEALLKVYEAKLSQLYEEQSGIVEKIELQTESLRETENTMFVKLTANCLNDITVEPMNTLNKYYKEVKSNMSSYLAPVFLRYNPNKGELIKKVGENFDKVVKSQIDSGVYLIKITQTMLTEDVLSIKNEFQKNMTSLGLKTDDVDLNIEYPETSFSAVVRKGEAKTKYSYATVSVDNVKFDEIDIDELVFKTYDNTKRSYSESEMFRLIRSKVSDSNEYNKEELTRCINEYHILFRNKLINEAKRIVGAQSEEVENNIESYMEQKRELFNQRHDLQMTMMFINSTNKLLTDLFKF